MELVVEAATSRPARPATVDGMWCRTAIRLMRGWTSAVDAGSRLCDFARLEFSPVAVRFFFYYW